MEAGALQETVLPRRQKLYPLCVLSSPRGEVALPGVSEVSSTRFCLVQKTGLSIPGQSLTKAIRARLFHFRCRNPAVRIFYGF